MSRIKDKEDEPQHVLITGGSGFLGRKLLKRLKYFEKKIVITVLDSNVEDLEGIEVNKVSGSISDAKLLRDVITSEITVIYHLAAVLSGAAEANYESAFEVNVNGTYELLQACKAAGHCPTFVFTSSVAVFGKAVISNGQSDTWTERSLPSPQSSYGTQKAMCELMIADATRRGIVKGLSIRLPTIAVRPGKPNSATSSFVSSIIREPISGLSTTCPVSPNLPLWIQSPRVVVNNLIHASKIAPHCTERIITLPGLSTTPKEMLDSLVKVGGDLSLVTWKEDEIINKVVGSWPGSIGTDCANSLGFMRDQSIQDVVEAFLEDDF